MAKDEDTPTQSRGKTPTPSSQGAANAPDPMGDSTHGTPAKSVAGKSALGKGVAVGAGVAIGSAAIAAALLYYGRGGKK